jgi:hypothetical protein
MDLISYSVRDFVLNAHPDKIALITEATSAIQSITASNEKNLTRERDQVWNMIITSIP